MFSLSFWLPGMEFGWRGRSCDVACREARQIRQNSDPAYDAPSHATRLAEKSLHSTTMKSGLQKQVLSLYRRCVACSRLQRILMSNATETALFAWSEPSRKAHAQNSCYTFNIHFIRTRNLSLSGKSAQSSTCFAKERDN